MVIITVTIIRASTTSEHTLCARYFAKIIYRAD